MSVMMKLIKERDPQYNIPEPIRIVPENHPPVPPGPESE
jgi:hypothetical protein